MAQNPYQDPNFLRRQREKRDAEKKARAAAELAKASAAKPVVTDAQSRQQAIDAKIQELLQRQSPPADSD